MTSFAPVSSQGRNWPAMPAMLTSGKAFSRWQPGFRPPDRMMFSGIASHSLWLRGTPLGTPSVPEVQQMVNTSLAPVGCSRSCCAIRSPSASQRGSASMASTVCTLG